MVAQGRGKRTMEFTNLPHKRREQAFETKSLNESFTSGGTSWS